ncbi:MAG: type II toxin-antitoxin system RelE/ParE family toxin [Elusimicrobia bacterium]|nr:type II toxin-antitoxin system RelE/ParE family toxin [Elusimicrobiota bacterium]
MSDLGSSAKFQIVFFPAAKKEYEKEVKQSQERAKIDAILEKVETYGFQALGANFEKVKGADNIYELKIKAFGSEHRFLFGYAPEKSPEGLPILILLRYLKKKQWKLPQGDIQAAVNRLRQF